MFGRAAIWALVGALWATGSAAQTIPDPVCHAGPAPFPPIATCAAAPVPDGWRAEYDAGTEDYAHGVLGDAIEWRRLVLTHGDGSNRQWDMMLPTSRVFEDVAPRIADLDGDGTPEVIVVETARDRGASLAIYATAGADGLTRIASTGYIGRTNRWLAPIGAADFDGDGTMDIAYIDRPHLARTLRVWRFEDDTLTEIASLDGLTNHRIGEPFITGGVRDCGAGPEMVTADTAWAQVMITRIADGQAVSRAVAPFSQDAVADALACGL